MYITLALLPALMWGLMPLLATYIGGSQHHQTLGVTLGALLLAIVIYIVKQPALDGHILWVGMLSGLCWSVGQINQFAAIHRLGVSKAMPLSTSMQLIFTALCGVLIFSEWHSGAALMQGSFALLLIVLGAVCTAYRDKRVLAQADTSSTAPASSFVNGLIRLLISTAGYVSYVIVLRIYDIDPWSALLPQALGMAGAAFIMSIGHKPFSRETGLNMVPGIAWGMGNVALQVTAPIIGVAVSFSLSQVSLVIATLGGIFILKEQKTSPEFKMSLLGVLLVIIGAVLIGYTR